jgi:hypothetical protein
MGNSRCKNCVNFQPHRPSPASCSKVSGVIEMGYWCELFAPKDK